MVFKIGNLPKEYRGIKIDREGRCLIDNERDIFLVFHQQREHTIAEFFFSDRILVVRCIENNEIVKLEGDSNQSSMMKTDLRVVAIEAGSSLCTTSIEELKNIIKEGLLAFALHLQYFGTRNEITIEKLNETEVEYSDKIYIWLLFQPL